MSYDIPDKIQYKEKIVFNLTFKQLIYASVFMLLAFFKFIHRCDDFISIRKIS